MIGMIIPTLRISGTMEVIIMAEYSSHRDLMRGSDMAWNIWLTVIPSQPEEGLFFSDLIALITLLSFIVWVGFLFSC